MAYGDIKRLSTQGQQIASTVGTLYTAPTGKRSQIGTILLHNIDTSSVDIEIFINGTADADRVLYITLDSSETYEFSPKVPLVLEGAQTLQGEASVADKANIVIFGREEI